MRCWGLIQILLVQTFHMYTSVRYTLRDTELPLYHAREHADAYGTLIWLLWRRWSMTAWRAAARLILDRLESVGSGAMRNHAHRAVAAESVAAVRRSSHWLFRRLQGR